MDELGSTPSRLEVIAQATAELRAARVAAQAALAYSDHAHAPVRKLSSRLSKITRLADEMATAGDPATPAMGASTELANFNYELDQAAGPLQDARDQVELGQGSIAAGRALLDGIDGAQALREQFDRFEAAFESAGQVLETAQRELPSLKRTLAPVQEWPKVSEDRAGHAALVGRLAGEAGRGLDPIDNELFKVRKQLEQVAPPLIDPSDTGPGADQRRKELDIARRAGTTPVPRTAATVTAAAAGSPTDPHRRSPTRTQASNRETGSR